VQKKVLIIDDEPSVGTLIKINLQRKGFAVETADSGVEGIGKARQERFDLVLLDVVLPAMSGIEVCKALRDTDSYEDTPIVMISSRSDGLTVETALAAGASGYLVKPFTFEELLRRIEDLLVRPSLFGSP
jgi:two-component system alkaline phosphatase synthesis response regulator PhoP